MKDLIPHQHTIANLLLVVGVTFVVTGFQAWGILIAAQLAKVPRTVKWARLVVTGAFFIGLWVILR